jgi:MFS family permease
VIVAGRALQGIGGGLLSAAAYAAIALAYSVELQPRMLATLSSAWVVPGLVGPGLASLIATHTSWRWVFLGLIPLSLLAGALAWPELRALRSNAPVQDGGRRVALAAALGVGASAVLMSLSASRWQLAVAGVTGGGALMSYALRGLMPPGTLTGRPGLPAAIATMALLTFAFFGAEAFVPLALHEVRGASVLLGGTALTSAALTWTLGAWLPVRLGPRIGRRALIGSGLTILAAGLLGTAALLWTHIPPAAAIGTWGITGLGMGLAFTTTSAAILESATPGQEGLAAASLQLAQVLGAALATGTGGAIVAASFAGSPPRLGIALVDTLMLGAVALALLVTRRIPQRRVTTR